MKRRDLIIAVTAFVIGVFMLMSCGRDGRNGTARDGAAAAKPQKQESAGKPVAKAETQSKTEAKAETKAETKAEKARGGEARQKVQSASASTSPSTSAIPIPEPRRKAKAKAKGKLVYYYKPG